MKVCHDVDLSNSFLIDKGNEVCFAVYTTTPNAPKRFKEFMWLIEKPFRHV